jgi:hypothetical protein
MPIDRTTGDYAMYAMPAPVESLKPTPLTGAFEATGPDARRSASTLNTEPAGTDFDVSAWARHAQSANGFGDGATD